MKKWTGLAIMCLIICIASSALYAGTDDGKSVSFGVNSSSGGYVTQVSNGGSYNYAKVVSVAPIVNRIKVMNSSNNNIIYDGCPAAGATFYIPKGNYLITGWSSYGTEDTSGVVISFTQTQTQTQTQNQTQTQTTSAPSASPSPSGQVTVDGQTMQTNQSSTTIYTDSPGSYNNPYNVNSIYYNSGYGGMYLNSGCGDSWSGQCSGLIFCHFCSKYHVYGKCVFTMPNNSILDPYNPYWRGNKYTNSNYWKR